MRFAQWCLIEQKSPVVTRACRRVLIQNRVPVGHNDSFIHSLRAICKGYPPAISILALADGNGLCYCNMVAGEQEKRVLDNTPLVLSCGFRS